eukprot:NODE_677_length_2190_cov_88.877600_g647_i0.p1 GENE.NODE_677_length_2190_cov_88.877600_g647_i0~~NODE_677_length_2190_cov_88.877600_g647_i0.p1  ORF type:complete len:678 (-),score=151.02 NODE_677_length_2190_cov_88.877600_g647_i0:95-2128(-)
MDEESKTALFTERYVDSDDEKYPIDEKKETLPSEIDVGEMIFGLDLHPSKNHISMGCVSGHVCTYYYDIGDYSRVTRYNTHKDTVRSIVYSLDGNVLYSVGSDRQIIGRDCESEKLCWHISRSKHRGPINKAIVCSEHEFMTGDDQGTILIWDNRQKRPAGWVEENSEQITDFDYSVQKNMAIATGLEGGFTVIDFRTYRELDYGKIRKKEFLSCAIMQHGNAIVVGTNTGDLFIWQWDVFHTARTRIRGHPGDLSSILPITDDHIITGARDGCLRLIRTFPDADREFNHMLGTIAKHDRSVNFTIENICLAHDNKFVAFASNDNVVYWADVTDIEGKLYRRSERKRLARMREEEADALVDMSASEDDGDEDAEEEEEGEEDEENGSEEDEEDFDGSEYDGEEAGGEEAEAEGEEAEEGEEDEGPTDDDEEDEELEEDDEEGEEDEEEDETWAALAEAGKSAEAENVVDSDGDIVDDDAPAPPPTGAPPTGKRPANTQSGKASKKPKKDGVVPLSAAMLKKLLHTKKRRLKGMPEKAPITDADGDIVDDDEDESEEEAKEEDEESECSIADSLGEKPWTKQGNDSDDDSDDDDDDDSESGSESGDSDDSGYKDPRSTKAKKRNPKPRYIKAQKKSGRVKKGLLCNKYVAVRREFFREMVKKQKRKKGEEDFGENLMY